MTGGAGYIGSHTCKLLAHAGHEPIAFDNLSEGHRWAVRWGPLVEGDLHDVKHLTRTLREYQVDAVIHFAASAYVGESVEQPRKYFRNNVVNSIHVLEAMEDAGVETIVFSSSCATYGPPVAMPMTEEHPRQPVNPYGESKLFVERALHWAGEADGLKWITLRYFNAAGADPDGELGECHDPETHLIPIAIGAALGEHRALEVYGTDYPTPDGTCIRDYTHVMDLAQAHVLALDHLARGGESTVLNLGTGTGHSVHEVRESVERVSGHRVPFVTVPRRPGDPDILVADASRAADVLGWVPEHRELDAIVQTAWKWHITGERPRVARIG